MQLAIRKLANYFKSLSAKYLSNNAISKVFTMPYILLALATSLFVVITPALGADIRFSSNYPCSDSGKYCASSGKRIVDGFEVYKDCWEWGYTKTCNYPSKNDCDQWKHCYAVADRECLMYDSNGNCVNIRREFSCKRRDFIVLDQEKAKFDPNDKARARRLVCKGIPCIDGNCVDKSYGQDEDLMDTIVKLYAVSQAKHKGAGVSIFPGVNMHCSKLATSYSNCCKVGNNNLFNNWGHNLWAKCSANEKLLLKKRRDNLCIYVGKENKGKLKLEVRHQYCCFDNLLNKVIQKEARRQLGISFGSAKSPNCRGLTLDELMQLDFSKMDLSEAYAELIKRMKLPQMKDVDSRVKGSMPNIKSYDNNLYNKANKGVGVNQDALGKE